MKTFIYFLPIHMVRSMLRIHYRYLKALKELSSGMALVE